MDIRTATNVVDSNFEAFDTAAQNNPDKADGKISQQDLETVARNDGGRFTDQQQQAAQFLLDSNASRSFLDVGAGRGSVDGTISREDIDGALETLSSDSFYDELLDTAAGGGSRDGHVGDRDLTAALGDPGIPDDLKDAINVLLLAPEGADGINGVLQNLTTDEVASIGSLATSESFRGLSGTDKQLVAEAIRDSGGDQNVTSTIRELVQSPRFTAMSSAERTSALSEIALVNSSEFQALPSSDQNAIRNALTSADTDDVAFAGKLRELIQSGQFERLNDTEKSAMLAQVENYPDSRVIDNFERALDKGWFQGQSTDDKLRSLKLIAHLSTFEGGDRTVLDNTLDRFLSPDSDYKLEWKSISASPGNVTYGYAGGNTLTLNEDLVAADSARVSGGTEGHVIENTTAHEVSHLVNGDSTNQTFHYLNEEYRAWYVGYLAENGHPPSNEEAVARWEYFLDPNGGYADYSHGKDGSWFFNIGAKDGALEKPEEAEQIFALLSQLTGVEITADNYADVLSDTSTWGTNPNDPASDDVFPDTDDLDN